MKKKGRPPFGSPEAQPSPVEAVGEGAATTTGKEELFIFLTFFHPFPRIAREMAGLLLLEVPGCSQNFLFTLKEENASKAIDLIYQIFEAGCAAEMFHDLHEQVLMTIDFESKKPLEVIFYGFEIMCWWMRQNDHYLVIHHKQDQSYHHRQFPLII
ncbi:hypothetical protein Taro_013620 [Colocasia esculenta]|uniref:Uncharacterized protein n=1 Tax=Colocasia esculenta TaxID=4460 RepID=A0A843UGH1_COLES|nr:hypothetical protein [Colocasia esculenta]